MPRVLVCLMFVLLGSIARGDVVHLARGGNLHGTLLQIKIEVDGIVSEVKRADIQSVRLGPRTQDRVKTKAGDQLIGTIEVVTVKTIGGQFTLTRDKLKGIDLSIKSGDQLVQEYRRRRDALKPEDVEGHLSLSKWCEDNGLTRQMRIELESCLACKPQDPRAQQWHKKLGHVLYNGKWMTRAEKDKAYEADMKAKGMVRFNGRWIDKDVHDRIKQTALKIARKLDDAEKQLNDQYEADKAKLRNTYEAELAKLNARIVKLETDIERLTEEIKDVRDALRQARAYGARDTGLSRQSALLGRQKSLAEKEVKALKKKKSSLAQAAKRRLAQLKTNSSRKLRSLKALRERYNALLLGQKVIEDATVDAAIAKIIGKK